MDYHQLLECKPLLKSDLLAYWRQQADYWMTLPSTWIDGGRAEWFITAADRVVACNGHIVALSSEGS